MSNNKRIAGLNKAIQEAKDDQGAIIFRMIDAGQTTPAKSDRAEIAELQLYIMALEDALQDEQS